MSDHGRDGNETHRHRDDDAGDHDHHGQDGHQHADDDHHDDHHHHHAHDVESLGVGVVTVSSSRSIDDDAAGDAIVEGFEDAGHSVSVRELVADDFDGIQSTVNRLVDRDDVDAVVTTGGTGVTPDDVTVEAVDDLTEKALPGFGELFRRLSYDEVGTRIVGTRATAGIVHDTPVFCLPGSENAARLGTDEILVAEAPHLAGLARRD
ncbi:MogA/MoaB family molybdenum cofactor biosynthesis protein [Halogeometricum limi]|uniref:Molybdenum cofactor biosynthesis protein B n=1 Tax=Halogeometricum limi TaxID=555875 RepID=A0A1I6HL69_9EURY|nr:molybdenum cofactor synthesis domain-containing protein [Halogeometricum limi]SFR55209.1 molybdenum cofactor biosynthesis protein B [Halogeometricum limi]